MGGAGAWAAGKLSERHGRMHDSCFVPKWSYGTISQCPELKQRLLCAISAHVPFPFFFCFLPEQCAGVHRSKVHRCSVCEAASCPRHMCCGLVTSLFGELLAALDAGAWPT